MTKLVLLLIPALAGAMIYAAQVSRQRDDARGQAVACTQKLADERAHSKALQVSIAYQNAAVESLKKAAEQSAAQMRARAKDARTKAIASMRDAEKQAGELNVATIGPHCTDAIEWGNARAKELGSW